MYGGFYDVALYHQTQEQAYFDATGDEEAFLKSRPPLSSDLIQPYKPPNPWPSSLTFEGDFVLVCEFSEIEGPIPLFTIPKEATGDFDDNAFALKIMAIDYNATNTLRSSIPFMLIDDTGVLLDEVQEGAYAYVHHFTLYDISARGFVRPFCMAYVTPDKKKLTTHLEWVLGRFKKISQLFCYGNRLNFQKDLQERLADLNYTLDQHVQDHPQLQDRLNDKPPDCPIPQYQTKKPEGKLAALQKSIQEVRNILSIIVPTLNNSRLDAQCRKYMRDKRSPMWRKRRRQSASVHEDGYHSDGEKEEHHSPKERGASSFTTADDLTPVVIQEETYTPKMFAVDGCRRFDKRLRTMHELCGFGCVQGLIRLKRLHKYFSRDHLIMRMEQRESNMVSPASALLTIGRTVTINFMQDIDWDRLMDYQAGLSGYQSKLGAYRNPSMSFSAFSLSSGVEEDIGSLASYEAKFVPGSTYASLESLYYDVEEHIESPHSSDHEEMEMSSKTTVTNRTYINSTGSSWCEVSALDFKDNHFAESPLENSFKSDTFNPDTDSSLEAEMPSSKSDPSISTVEETSEPDSSQKESDSLSSVTSDDKGEKIQVVDSMRPVTNRFTSSMDSDYTRHVAGSGEPTLRRHYKVPVGSFISRLSSFKPDLPGCGIKNFAGHCVFAVHVIYALLSGRTVVIAASPKYEKEVNSLIKTLWLFIPGHSSRHHLVVPWHTKPLTILDLSRMKLVGIAVTKSLHRVVPRSVQRYVSVYDYENSTLWTPPYKGTYINRIVSGHKHFLSDQAYIAYIQGILLDMATKAYLYYHSFCLNSPPSMSNDEGLRAVDRHYRNASAACLNKLGLMEGDTKIIEYWVDIIKQQQIDEAFVPGPPASTIKLDLRQCTRYQM